MLEKIANYIAEYTLIDQELPVVVGVSGGLDSLCALIVLKELGYRVICAHFDHRLRPESSSDLQFVHAAASNLGVPFAAAEADVREFAGDQRLSLEEAGRMLRYRFLFETARREGAGAVVTGHTADDQVETVLMHFLRGAGLSGLRGMQPATVLPSFDHEIPLVRPLLCMSRKELEHYAAGVGLVFLNDPTNSQTDFYRNRLRHELLPQLETYNPGIRDTILRSAAALAIEDSALRESVDAAWLSVFVKGTPDFIELDRAAFLGQHPGIRTRLLRKGAATLLPSLRDIDFNGILRGLESAGSGSPFRSADLGGGLLLLAEAGSLWIAKDLDLLPVDRWPSAPKERLDLPLPGEIHLGGGWVLSADWQDSPAEVPEDDPFRVLVDAEHLPGGLQVRRRQQGDRFEPAGMQGHTTKISDFMINEKLPRRARAGWPLVVSGERILWVCGMRLAEPAGPVSRTSRKVRLSLLRR